MQYWLLKSEPSKWSWDMQVQAGEKGTFWDGVRNHLAKQHLMKMRKNDLAFFYHSNEGKEIVGIVEIIKEHYPDPNADIAESWVMVDVKAVRKLDKPVSLTTVKADDWLGSMALVTSMRLSVQPVTQQEWHIITKMGKADDL